MRAVLPGLLALLAGCMTEPAGQVDLAPQEPIASPAFDEIQLTRAPCFGRCPVYSVTVHADGRVDYRGERWVASTGERSGQADPQELARLRAFLEANPLPLVADYRPGKPACGTPVATDMPGATITVRQAGGIRRIFHYQGCPDAPDWLAELATRIDSAAVSSRWVDGPEDAPVR